MIVVGFAHIRGFTECDNMMDMRLGSATWRGGILCRVQPSKFIEGTTTRRRLGLVRSARDCGRHRIFLRGLALRGETDGIALFWPAAGVSAGVLIALGRDARLPVVGGVTVATIVARLERHCLRFLQCR